MSARANMNAEVFGWLSEPDWGVTETKEQVNGKDETTDGPERKRRKKN